MSVQIKPTFDAQAPASHDQAHQTDWNLDGIVDGLRQSREIKHNIRFRGRISELPERDTISRIMDLISAALFPTHYGRPDLNHDSIDYFVGSTLNTALNALTEQVRRGLMFSADSDNDSDSDIRARATRIVRAFGEQLPAIRDMLVSDLHAAYKGDPSATSISEILICFPGMTAVIHYRVAHALYKLGATLPARLISEIAHSSTGIDIHPAAEIGEAFFIDHGTGVVVGQTAIIGDRVRLYQAVTLGAKSFPADENGTLIKGIARHPIVEDDVVIYSGATILGRITIGAGSTIGGNVWLTQSVPPGSNVTQAQMRNDCAMLYEICSRKDEDGALG
ncbi:serine O-acetyltransferase EpsC [Iodidimonas sp. SYSU 1G8]|uniref:serine O-acetyltransferase EpsC n=1 Tax=Iodidimonas sp. SYSU 1G8 TaxID=3133967 RepID=UPI0031FE6C57